MAESFQKDTIFEHKEDLMIASPGGIPTRRLAHFLKPTSESITGPNLKLPSLSPSSKWPIKVAFNGWRNPMDKWGLRVILMRSRYESVWRKAGIFDAIMASTFKILRNPELIFGLGERWCPETNTFIFPFGEATITLEDMMVLGGFSVLGYSVLMPLETKELLETQEKLEKLRKQLWHVETVRKDRFSEWIYLFMESGNEVEHEAFLSVWLSRFVFPGPPHDRIRNCVFPIAIHLARGTRIALAPAVLASLYRDLALLKETIVASRELDPDSGEDGCLPLTLWAPFLFVQVWGWERIPHLQPKPNSIGSGNLRLARWNGTKVMKIENVQSLIDSAGESFLWRPYAMGADKWSFPKFYKEEETWVSHDSELDGELESFLYFLRVSELSGLDCTEPYFPNRVAMQFGMDQDLPGWFPRSTTTRESLWRDYIRPIRDTELYIPPRLFESDITMRYFQWWKTVMSSPEDLLQLKVVRKKRTPRRSKRLEKLPGFAPNYGKLNGGSRLIDNDDATANELDGGEGEAELHGILYSRKANGDVKWTGTESLRKPMKESMKESIERTAQINDNGRDSRRSIIEWMGNLNLEARISRLERVVGAIKMAKLGQNRLHHGSKIQ